MFFFIQDCFWLENNTTMLIVIISFFEKGAFQIAFLSSFPLTTNMFCVCINISVGIPTFLFRWYFF